MDAAKIIAFLSVLLCQPAFAQNNMTATPSPRNIGEAAGQYAGAAAFTRYVKSSPCGYAVTRETPPLSAVIKNDIAFRFPAAQQGRLYRGLMDMEPVIAKQNEQMFSSLYRHYTSTERLDHRTACGFVAGGAISTQKLAIEALDRMSR